MDGGLAFHTSRLCGFLLLFVVAVTAKPARKAPRRKRRAQEQIPGGTCGWAAESQPRPGGQAGENHGIPLAVLRHTKGELDTT